MRRLAALGALVAALAALAGCFGVIGHCEREITIKTRCEGGMALP